MTTFNRLTEETNQNETIVRDQEKCRCCGNIDKIAKHLCLYGLMFISITTLDLAQSTNDWLLYFDVSKIQKGLVYGPLDPYLILIYLIICSVSTIASVFEILNFLRYLCAGRPLIDLDLLSAIIIWFCDVSMLTVNILIAVCHSEPISYFQLTKAILMTVAVVVRILVPHARIYIKNRDKERRVQRFRKSVYRMLTTIGVCLMLVGAVSIFIFTHTITSDNGKPEFLLPGEILEGKITYERYFKDVGIYFTHDNLKFPEKNNKERYWIKLVDIKEFYSESSINIKLSYRVRDGAIQKLILLSYNSTSQRYKECYSLDDKGLLNLVENCNTDYITNPEDMIFQFVYLRPSEHLILGNILFNAKYRADGACHDLPVNNTKIFDIKGGKVVGQLLYMKHDTQAQEGHRLVQHNSTSEDIINGDSPKYKTQHFLVDIKEIWRMGMYGCDTTGNIGPVKNDSISLTC